MDKNLETKLVHSIFQFKRLASTGFGMEMVQNKSNINISELILMSEIADNTTDSEHNVVMSDIRGYLSVSKAAVSQMLRSLEKKGLINRNIDKNNRRNLIVTLTPEGRKVLESQYDAFQNRLGKIVSHLGEDDVRHMITIVNHMIEITNTLNHESKKEDGT